jgi:hypothetical protein
MAIFKYTLPSGARFQLTAPSGTTQIEADKIFYEQVAAGTFVGYKPGDTLTNPQQALTNFGLSRLERGTAGVPDQTIVAIISGLPLVATLPSTLAATPVINPITTTDFLQVNVNSTNIGSNATPGVGDTPTGNFSLGQEPVGQLSPTQVRVLMGQLSAIVAQPYNALTQSKGLGKYGFSAQQLERAGLIKPGYADRFSAVDPATQKNPSTFVSLMNTPGIWTGKNNINTLNDILGDAASQNQVQQTLMNQGYQSLVSSGTIVPPAAAAPSTSTGQVYNNTDGTLVAASGLSLLTAAVNFNPNQLNTFGSLFASGSAATSALGTVTLGKTLDSIQSLGSNAVASINSGLTSLQSGAAVFANQANAAVQSGLAQISNLASGNIAINNIITSNLNGDIGALVTNASKYGPAATTLWAQGNAAFGTLSTLSSKLPSLDSINVPTLDQISAKLPSLSVTGLSDSLKSGLDQLGKGSQFGINFSDFSLSGLISSIQPAAAFTNTVNRATIDAAVTRVIGSEKISSPAYELPSLASLGIDADITQAKSILQSLGNQAVNVASNLPVIRASQVNQILKG